MMTDMRNGLRWLLSPGLVRSPPFQEILLASHPHRVDHFPACDPCIYIGNVQLSRFSYLTLYDQTGFDGTDALLKIAYEGTGDPYNEDDDAGDMSE